MTIFWVGVCILAACGSLCFFLTRQLMGRVRTVRRGIAVEGRCVRRFSTNGSDGDTYWHHVHGFTTLEGQYIEFQEDAMLLAEGNAVTVRYRPADPARTATIMGSGGSWAPLFGSLFGILVSGMLTLLGVLFVFLGFSQ
ncbi:DUF3592 domain-containing protein [Streptomyces sp. NPDC048416]|uniref:DUF3592 domain-containing protein n=1 Tax=Streptomyces sp. NPDC048416 TaxID=3365546 RepID=UPI00371E95FC